MTQVLIQSEKISKEYDLCENCLGRLFSKKLGVTSNKLLGKKLRKKLKQKSTKCYICKNMFSNIPRITFESKSCEVLLYFTITRNCNEIFHEPRFYTYH